MAAPTLAVAIATFRAQKTLAERAITQVGDDGLRRALHPETNSIAVIMKHMAGNMRSRWTDFLATDGEKPDRRRDEEFIDRFASREEILADWESGWARLFATLEGLSDDDLGRTIRIRGAPHTVLEAVDRQLSHYAYHVGQIVLIARIVADRGWRTLSIPRGESEQYNRRVWEEGDRGTG